MTWIEATCPTCGTVECMPEDFELSVCEDEATASWYAFDCPVCNDRIQKHAEARVIELLIAEGVVPSVWTIPAEAREQHDVRPLTIDDVLDMQIALARPDWFELLAGQKAS